MASGNDNSVFYSVLAIALVVGFALYLLGPEVGFSPDIGVEGVWCGSDDEQRDNIYENYLNAYKTCLDAFQGDDGGLAPICSILENCNDRNGYPECLEECKGARSLVENHANFCENLRIKIENFVRACYKEGENPYPVKFTPCEDSCIGNNQGS